MGSVSIPFAFTPVKIDDLSLIDGGTFTMLNLGDPIERCLDQVQNERDVIVDVLFAMKDPNLINKWERDSFQNIFTLDKRSNEITEYIEYYNEVLSIVRGYPNVTWRHIIAPNQKLPSSGLIPISTTKE